MSVTSLSLLGGSKSDARTGLRASVPASKNNPRKSEDLNKNGEHCGVLPADVLLIPACYTCTRIRILTDKNIIPLFLNIPSIHPNDVRVAREPCSNQCADQNHLL